MKKVIITGLILALSICAGKAQSYETSIEINKNFQSAICIDLSNTVKDVEAAVEKRFAENGLKGKNFKGGFTEYKSVKFSEFAMETINIYTKVEKNKSNKQESKLYILVAMQDGQFCSSGTCENIISNVKTFADKLIPHVELYMTGVEFEKNTDELKKAEKELKNLEDDSVSLQKDKEKILRKIDENTQKVHNKQKEVEMKRQVINDIQIKKTQQEANLPK